MRNMIWKGLPLASLMAGAAMRVPYDTGSGWKMTEVDGKKFIETKDGNPIWIDANGGEQIMQGDTITRLNGEAKTLRTRMEAAEAKVKDFEGVDATAAKKAIDTISKLDAKKLIDAGEVDKVRDAMKAEFTGQINELTNANKAAQDRINGMLIDGVFAGSEFIRERIAIPRDMLEASMRKHFAVGEDGKIEIKDRAGNRLMSKKNIGDFADPDEALELLIDAHPQKATILKADDQHGSGNNGNGGSRQGGTRVLKRADFEKLGPVEQAAKADAMGKGELTIVD